MSSLGGDRPGALDDPEDGRRPTDGTEPSETRLYRWTCPFCGEFGIQSVTPEDVERYVVNALRSHVRSTDGGGHGPKQAFPDDHVETAIDEYVETFETGR